MTVTSSVAGSERFARARAACFLCAACLVTPSARDRLRDPAVSERLLDEAASSSSIRPRSEVCPAADDLLELARAFGGVDARVLRDASAEQLQRTVESATINVHTGEDDRLLRRLAIDARLRADLPPDLEDTLRAFGRARFILDLGIANPNGDVSVEEPPNAQPYPGD